MAESTYSQIMEQDEKGNPYSEFELSRYMYETRLGNVFSDYEKNQEYLKQEKRESLQDAYYIKEMNKKYLGQYASNTGIGDVSGNLMDIYSKHHETVQGISKNYSERSFELQKEYQQTRQTALEGILTSQYGINVERMQEKAQQVWFNALNGNTGGLTEIEYFDKAYDDGLIDSSMYRAFVSSIQEQTVAEVSSNLQSGYYGYTYDEDGNRVLNTDPVAYIEQNRDNLTARSYRTLLDLANTQKMITEATETHDVVTPKIVDAFGNVIDNPYYVGADYNYDVLAPSIDVDKNSVIGFTDSAGNKYFSHKTAVDDDEEYETTAEDLFDQYTSKTGNDVPASGEVIDVITKDDDDTSTVVSYIFNNGKWYRLGREETPTINEMRTWNTSGGRKDIAQGYIDHHSGFVGLSKKDKIVYNDKKYRQHMTPIENPDPGLVSMFKTVHGENVPNNTYVFYNGVFYAHYDGKYYPFFRA
jgi:hypothetical protein